jgi:hypothetical protein
MATYYVRQAGGSDANAGTSFALGWATLQKAFDTAVAGDLVLVCADGTHAPTVYIDVDTNSGTVGSPIIFRGASAVGADDGTTATITGASVTGALALAYFYTVTGERHYEFENLRFTAGKANTLELQGNQQAISFRNCRIDTATGDGIRMDNSTAQVILRGCSIDNNTEEGVGQSTNSRGNIVAIGCAFHHNGGSGIDVGGANANVIDACTFYRNTLHGIKTDGGFSFIGNSTFYLNSQDGINTTVAIQSGGNNIFASNGSHGVDHGGTQRTRRFFWTNNLYHNNTSGNVDINSGVVTNSDYNAITGSDPLFVSTTNNSEDFALQSSSPAKAAGFPGAMYISGTGYRDIGALQRQEPAGGGTSRGYIIGG